ncbi:MAG TPA: divalent-cation tolerance protein CutA [Castellaniella sp.]|uniref:divalent-cation tolerance protein CutA n=1 Tax=Castellaniella sp. TaxID=1955812 RepID=UPI002F1A03DE
MTDQTLGAVPALRRQGSDPADTVVVLTTAPDGLLAKRIAHVLVEESLVACAHVGSAVSAMYLWQGKLEGGDEYPLTLKTTADALPRLYARLCSLHPYELPEFLVLGVAAGSQSYLDWVAQATRPAAEGAL